MGFGSSDVPNEVPIWGWVLELAGVGKTRVLGDRGFKSSEVPGGEDYERGILPEPPKRSLKKSNYTEVPKTLAERAGQLRFAYWNFSSFIYYILYIILYISSYVSYEHPKLALFLLLVSCYYIQY